MTCGELLAKVVVAQDAALRQKNFKNLKLMQSWIAFAS